MLKKKGDTLKKRESLAGFLFSLPAIIGMLIFFIVPFLISVYRSFQRSIGSPDFVGFANYQAVLESGTFQLAAFNTGRFIVVAIPLIIAFSFAVALMLQKITAGSAFFRSLFVFPLVLPTVSVAFFFQIIFDRYGALNNLLTSMGLPLVDWLQSEQAFFVLVLLYIWKNCGYNIILFTAALSAVPKELYEAAEIDGASEWQKTLHITLPLILPYTFVILLLSIINAFKSFKEAYILCGDYPHTSIYMLQHFINNNLSNLNFIRVFSGTVLVFAVIFVLVLLLLHLKKRAGDVEL